MDKNYEFEKAAELRDILFELKGEQSIYFIANHFTE